MRRFALLAVFGLVVAACAPSTEETTDTSADAPATTRPQATTTAPPAPTTTAAPVTTTTEPPADLLAIDTTPVVGTLDSYGPGGEALFAPGSVEAHWYQWNNLFVVLYRGFDAVETICAGNSILIAGAGFNNITNSPHLGTADELCVDAAKVAEAPSGVRACGSLLYYVTEITTDQDGDLYGTLEINDGTGWIGQTSAATTDLANMPTFEPDLPGYELPPSGVDPGGPVTCQA